MNTSILDAALDYAAKGWPVFPCKPDKAPYIKGGFKSATLDINLIRMWWNKWPDAMIGVPMGKSSGIWALDVDVAKKQGDANGHETLDKLIIENGQLPATYTQKTPSGGGHYLFKIPPDLLIKCSTKTKAPGLDIKSDGGYVIMAPSINDAGAYELIDGTNPVDAPSWLLDLVTKRSTVNYVDKATNYPELHPYVAKTLKANMEKIANAEPGMRNDILYKNVAYMAGYIPNGNLDETLLHDESASAYLKCNPEDFAKEFENTFRSAVEQGKNTPKEIPALLPPNFRLVKSGLGAGLWYDQPSQKNSDITVPFKIGAPLIVCGDYRDNQSHNWGKLVEWSDPDKIPHRYAIPGEILAGSDSSAWRSVLAAEGYSVAGGRKANELLTQYLCGCQPATKFIGVNRTGWHDNCFILPDETLSLNKTNNIILVKSLLSNPYTTAGTLEEWQNNIGRLASGNSRLIFALCVAFAAPLLKPLGQESCGFNFVGQSSIGKSTALFVAASVWGKGSTSDGYIMSWRATDNGLEAQAELHADTLLCLDELSQAPARVVAETTYMLGNSQGKARAKKNGDNRQVKNWRIMFLSSGEQSLEDKMSEDGKRAKAGQTVRMIDIPADAERGMGLFENLNGFEDAQALADSLKHFCSMYYGTASRAFIERIMLYMDKKPEVICQIFEQFSKDLCPEGADGQVKRTAQKFALCITAGLIAAAFDVTNPPILPVQPGDVSHACKECFNAWLSQRGGSGAWEDKQVIDRARQFLITQKSRFESLDNKLPIEPIVHNRAGFYREENKKTTFYILSEIFKKEIACGIPEQRAAKALFSAGILHKSDENRWQVKLPQIVKDVGRPWVYALSIYTDE